MATSGRIDELRKRYEENQRRFFAPLANEYRKAGDLEQAIGLCRVHLAEVPANLSGQIVFGQALFEAGSLDEARAAFETAIGLDPENLIALRHLGDIARLQSDVPRARVWYQRVLDADRRNEDVRALMAELEAVDPAPAAPAPGSEPDAAADPESAAQSEAATPEQPAVELQPLMEMRERNAPEARDEPVHIELEEHFPEPAPSLRPTPAVPASLISLTPTVSMDAIPAPISVSEPTPLVVPAFDYSLHEHEPPAPPPEVEFEAFEPVVGQPPAPVSPADEIELTDAEPPEQFTPDSSFGFEIDLGAAANIPVAPEAPATAGFGEVTLAEPEPAPTDLTIADDVSPAPDAPMEHAAATEFEAVAPHEESAASEEPIILDFHVPAPTPRRSTPAVVDSFELIDAGKTPLSSSVILEPDARAEPALPPAVVYELEPAGEIELVDATAQMPADAPPTDEAWEPALETPPIVRETPETPVADLDFGDSFHDTSPVELAPFAESAAAPVAEPAAESAEPVAIPVAEPAPTAAFQTFAAIRDMETPVLPLAPVVETFATETMAELYVRQGLRHEAIGVYRQLVAARPTEGALRKRLEELEAEGQKTTAGPSTARAFFAGLAGNRATPRSVPVQPAAVIAPAVDGTVDALFGRASVAAHDERSARALADAFGEESDDRAASADRGIDRLFNLPSP